MLQIKDISIKNKKLILDMVNPHTSIEDSLNTHNITFKNLQKYITTAFFRAEGPYHYGSWYKNYAKKDKRKAFPMFEEIDDIDKYTSDIEAIHYSIIKKSNEIDRLKFINTCYNIDGSEIEIETIVSDKGNDDNIRMSIKSSNNNIADVLYMIQLRTKLWSDEDYNKIGSFLIDKQVISERLQQINKEE